MNTLPTLEDIKKWTNEKLDSIIKSGEAINWNCGLTEDQNEIDYYVESLYSEKELRDNKLNLTQQKKYNDLWK